MSDELDTPAPVTSARRPFTEIEEAAIAAVLSARQRCPLGALAFGWKSGGRGMEDAIAAEHTSRRVKGGKR